MIAKYINLSNIISVASDNILRLSIQEPLLILKKFKVPLHTLSAYSSAIKFAGLIPWNVCLQAEGMLKPIKTLVFIQHHVERTL